MIETMAMRVELDISQNILNQFCIVFGVSPQCGRIAMDEKLGVGQMYLLELPNKLEFYHYTSQLIHPLELTSINPRTSQWFGLIINMSDSEVTKTVNNNRISLQRYLDSGVLIYLPGAIVESTLPAHHFSESVFIRFHHDFLTTYFDVEFAALQNTTGLALFEHLDYQSENLIKQAINAKSDSMKVHVCILDFMRLFFNKLKRRESGATSENLHAEDMKGLFRASAKLRNPVIDEIPSLEDLAETANMGMTKFKLSFKQVFGKAPIQYHQHVRMEYARDELLAKRKTPSELSYELGYSHPSKFTSAFKKQFNELPSQI